MAPVLCGFVGGLLGAYWGFKGEWPAVTVMVFAGAGFAISYGAALGIMVKNLGAAMNSSWIVETIGLHV